MIEMARLSPANTPKYNPAKAAAMNANIKNW